MDQYTRTMIENICSKVDRMRDKLVDLDVAIRGNGQKYSGIIGRLERLEHSESIRTKLQWVLGAGLVALIFAKADEVWNVVAGVTGGG